MDKKQTFETRLEKAETSEATGIAIPFDVEEVFGAKRVPVKVSINKIEHRSTIARMDGKYSVIVPKKIRDAAGVKAGDMITVEMEKDLAVRRVEIPAELTEALQKAGLRETFDKLSYTNQKEHANAVIEAKKEETKQKRIDKTIKNLLSQKSK